jgi:hypothetical protein
MAGSSEFDMERLECLSTSSNVDKQEQARGVILINTGTTLRDIVT